MIGTTKRKAMIVLTLSLCFSAALLAAVPLVNCPPVYDPWYDVNDDGKIDLKDYFGVGKRYGSEGQNISKASIEYDSGWINITGMQGQSITIEHNLGITNWDDPKLMVDTTGKTRLDDTRLQRYMGLTQVGWSRAYGGARDYYAYALVRTADGMYALAGGTGSSGAQDFWLVKTNAGGSMEWNRTYGGTNDDYATALVQTIDGGYALAGHTTSYGAGGADFWLVRTGSAGNAQWNKTYGGTSDDVASSLVQTADGGYALAGSTISFGAGSSDFWLAKTDSNGNMQWNKTYGGAGYDFARSLVQTIDGGYALAGCTDTYGAGTQDFWLVKTDDSGNVQWNKTYGGASTDYATALVQTIDGGYALAGYTASYGAGKYSFWLVKTNAGGSMEWNRTYGGTNDDYATALVQTIDGGYALAGSTNSYGAGEYDFWLVKTDDNGNAQWDKTYGGISREWAHALVQTVDGGYALAGYTGTYGYPHWYNFWLVKTDAGGNFPNANTGLAWIYRSANTLTLYRGLADADWNYVRVRISKAK